MQFSQIPDHDEVKEKLTDLVNNNRLSHALLFLGKEGSGALPMAIAFAQYILCERNQSVGKEKPPSLFGDEASPETIVWPDSCGVCATCSKVNQLIHPDLHFSYPALKRDPRHDKVLSTDYAAPWREFIGESPYGNVGDWIDFLKANSKLKIESPANKQGNITVHECEDILRKFSLKAFENKYKILIMWMPEYLGVMGNKLLKLIEEPPPDTLFIFVAEDESRILPTILSRTQLIKIPLFDHATLCDTLVKNDGVDEEKASQIATLAEGNIREAFQLMQNSEEDWHDLLKSWLNVSYKNSVSTLLPLLDELNRLGREKQKQFLKYFIHITRQSILLEYIHDGKSSSIPPKEMELALNINKLCGFEAKEAIIEEMEKSIYYIERNAHAKMLFHALTIRLHHIFKDKSLILVQ